MDFKDYYSILGVPKSASRDEIRKAFRKLARKYHPDVAADKAGADQKFKEINEAYEVLGDEDKRRKYDQLGSGWNRAANEPPTGWRQGRARGAGSPQGRPRSFRFEGTGFSDFFEEFFGSAGSYGGGDPFAEAGRGSAGREQATGFHEFSVRGADVEGDIAVSLEESLNGAVREVAITRQDRAGGEQRESFKVRIPPGVRDGQRLRVPAKGDPGMGSGGAGDLFLNVRMQPHPLFRIQGADLAFDLELAPWEAVLGARVQVETLDGRVTVRVPAGTQAGKTLRVRGRGLPLRDDERGDLLLHISIAVPSKVSARERELWERLASESTFNPR